MRDVEYRNVKHLITFLPIGLRVLRDILPDNDLESAQFNAVVPSQEEMDRVGVEPTTSTHQLG
jgi:hypothetical protein